MKHPTNQNQDKLPQVYMKQFGYDYKGHPKVSVLQVGEKFTRQKSIESFLSETNILILIAMIPKLSEFLSN